jgi:hypothetical protein
MQKNLDKIQHPCMIKPTEKLGINASYHNIIKAIYNKHSQIMLGKLSAFSLKSGMKQGFLLSPLLCNIVPESLGRAIRQKKKIKWEKSNHPSLQIIWTCT